MKENHTYLNPDTFSWEVHSDDYPTQVNAILHYWRVPNTIQTEQPIDNRIEEYLYDHAYTAKK
jgi:hypothetical protein